LWWLKKKRSKKWFRDFFVENEGGVDGATVHPTVVYLVYAQEENVFLGVPDYNYYSLTTVNAAINESEIGAAGPPAGEPAGTLLLLLLSAACWRRGPQPLRGQSSGLAVATAAGTGRLPREPPRAALALARQRLTARPHRTGPATTLSVSDRSRCSPRR
jgi:hypothetical protein